MAQQRDPRDIVKIYQQAKQEERLEMIRTMSREELEILSANAMKELEKLAGRFFVIPGPDDPD